MEFQKLRLTFSRASEYTRLAATPPPRRVSALSLQPSIFTRGVVNVCFHPRFALPLV